MYDEEQAINFTSVLEIPCIVINGQQLGTRTQLVENLKLIGGQSGLKELLGFLH